MLVVTRFRFCARLAVMIGAFLFALTATSGHVRAAQQFRTPGEVAKALNWDEKTKGPLLYLPYRALQVQDTPQWEDGFLTAACGRLHVIAPAEMTAIDPDYRQTPNFYDGLPRRLKVLYLASTFSESQWKTACGDGIGFSDMDRSQQAVY